jgi:hypothetical protein
MAARRIPRNGGLPAFKARIERYPDAMARLLAQEMARYARMLVPRDTGHLAATIGAERVRKNVWVCFAAAEYAIPVEMGHRVYNQHGGPYGWVAPNPFMRPAFETVISQAQAIGKRARSEVR